MWKMHVECMSITNERSDRYKTKGNTCKTHVREDAKMHYGSHVKRSYDRVTCQVMG